MAESVGEIYYTCDARTEKLVDSGRKATTSLDELQGAFDKTDKAADGTGKKLDRTGDSLSDLGKDARDAAGKVDGAGKSITAVGVGATGATSKLDGAGRAVTDLGNDAKTTSTSLDKLNGGLSKVDSGAKQAGISSEGFGAKLTPLAGAIAGIITVSTLKTWGELANQFTLLQSRIDRLSPSVEQGAKTYQSLLAISSQTGQSMGSTVKLWESLTSALKELGATNNQVLTLTSTLGKIGAIGGSSAEETANALRQLGQSLAGGTLRAEEYNSIVEQTPELVRQLAKATGMSMGDFRQAMLDGKLTSEQLFDALMKGTAGVNAEFAKLPRTVAQAANSVTTQFGAALSVIDKATGASQRLARALDLVARGIQLSASPTDLDKFNTLIEQRAIAEQQYQAQLKAGLTVTAANTKTRLDGLNKEIQAMQNARVEEQKREGKQADAPKQAKATSVDGQKALKEMAWKNAALRAEGVERAQLLAVQDLGASATKEEIALAKALAKDSYNLAEAEKARTKAKTEATSNSKKEATKAEQARKKAIADQKKLDDQAFKGAEQNQKAFEKVGVELANVGKTARETAQDAAELSLNKYATPEQVTSIRAIAAALYDAKQAKQLLASVDPIAAQGISYADDVKALQDANAQKLISDQRYQELKHQLEVDNAEKMKALQEANFTAASKGNELLFASIDALSQGATQSIAGLLSGTASLNDALGGIANTVLQTVVGAFVQMGTDWVKQQIMMQAQASATTATQVAGIGTVAGVQAGATAAIAATTTTTAATTGAAVATSMAPAAGLSSIASFGSAAVIGGAALLGTMLLAKSFGGGRQYGGPVNANSAYRVNETGAPEIFNAANGRQYMMPNQAGHVVSNKDATAAGGGGAAPIVNVNNYSGQAATTRSRFSEADRRYIIDVVVGDQQGGGRISKSTNQITGTKRRGT
jgi:tape measure domain-containing protein